MRQVLASRLLWTLGSLLLLAVPLRAQPPGQTIRTEPYSARGPVTYGRVTYYGAEPAYTGAPLRRVDETDVGFVSHYTLADSPIFFTSINYPGVYGSHTIGIQARAMTASLPRMRYYLPANGVALRDIVPLGPTQTVEVTTPSTTVASITVQVPANAELYFQGERMTKTGTVRDFVTPALLTSRTYTYDVRAVWEDKDGRPVVRERQLTVRSGDKIDLDMMAAPSETQPEQLSQPTLRTAPLPRAPRR